MYFEAVPFNKSIFSPGGHYVWLGGVDHLNSLVKNEGHIELKRVGQFRERYLLKISIFVSGCHFSQRSGII